LAQADDDDVEGTSIRLHGRLVPDPTAHVEG
jgi:hypothetical protein